MLTLPLVADSPALSRRLPPWLHKPLPQGNENFFTRNLLWDLGLETVCDNARCPNRQECYAQRTATFLIMGNTCTRRCGFCSVGSGRPKELAEDEPERVAEAVWSLGLRHVVITSVTRDDLADGGAAHFARCIKTIRQRTNAAVEVLTPDFLGQTPSLDKILEAAPEVFNHNLETVPRLYRRVRARADYSRSLGLLSYVKRKAPQILTKTGLMLGLGETAEELMDVLADLREVGCDLLTLGQYLPPTFKHLRAARFVPPSEFEILGNLAGALGFRQVASGPFVRSSYHAGEMVHPHG